MTPTEIREMADRHLFGTITPFNDWQASETLRILADVVDIQKALLSDLSRGGNPAIQGWMTTKSAYAVLAKLEALKL